MFDRVTLARLNAEHTIKEAVKAFEEGNDWRYQRILQANKDLISRILAETLKTERLFPYVIWREE